MDAASTTATAVTWLSVWPLVAFGIVQLVAIVSLYYGLKADITALASNLALSALTERTQRQAEHGTLKEQVMGLVAKLEAEVKELVRRVATLETGQDEWTRTLRERTHDLSNHVNSLVLKVDRLERPAHDPARD